MAAFFFDDPKAQIPREVAIRIVKFALPELEELAQQRPEFVELAKELKYFLSVALEGNEEIRLDTRAIEALSGVLQKVTDILQVPVTLSKDGGQNGVLASLQNALISLGATLIGKELPVAQPLTKVSYA